MADAAERSEVTEWSSRLPNRISDRQIRMGRRWYLLSFTRDMPPKATKEFVERYGVKMYCPFERVMRPIPRRLMSYKQRAESALVTPMRPYDQALFPGYGFGEFNYFEDRWRELFKLAFIGGIKCENNMPLPVLDGFVDFLRGKEVDGAVPGDIPLKELPLVIGERVRVAYGPFAGFEATVEELPDVRLEDLDESARVKLLVHVFGRPTPIDMNLEDVEKLSSHPE